MLDHLITSALPALPKFVVSRVARRYVAGERLQEAIEIANNLNKIGAMATIDLLGEEVKQEEKASYATDEYIKIFDEITRFNINSNVSVKLTLLGLKINENLCSSNLERLVVCAEDHKSFLRIDMEDHSCTDATLRLYKDVHSRHQSLGVVLQAYLRRTLEDVDQLPSRNVNVRVCKGIYNESRQIAWKDQAAIRDNFMAIVAKLFRNNVYTAIATHDETLVCRALALIEQMGIPKDRYEFQMLLGVDEELRDIIIASGHRVRIYLPYGKDWHPYSIRRLKENPRIARHVIRALTKTATNGNRVSNKGRRQG